MLIDSHCHLDFFDDTAIKEIIKNANTVGVSYMLNACSSQSSFEKIIDIVKKYNCIFGAIGQHPQEAEREGVVPKQKILNYISKNKKIIAIGETGLDYSQENFNKNLQIENLINHIEIAQETGLPIIIHNRDSNEDMINILSSYFKKSPFKAIIHCFTADKKMADAMLNMEFYISASGIITFKNASDLRDVFKTIPFEKLLVETDSPYLAPVPYRGKQNQPSFVIETAKKLAEITQTSFNEIAQITSNNFKRLFNLDIN